MISIPVQGLQNFPLATVDFDDPGIYFDMNLQGQQISFEGELSGEEITGTFTQQGQSIPFVLAKAEKQLEEPQNLAEIEVKGGTMKALIEMPKGEGPFPVMLIIAGSGPTDKDGNSLALPGKNNGLKMLAEELAKQGIASIRYDKRGVGDNLALAGSEKDLRFDDYINDAAAWLEFAKKDESFSEDGVIGHSEGSLIGMEAAEKASADAYISVAGPAEPIDQILRQQLQEQLPEPLMEEAEAILEQLKQGQQVETVDPQLNNIFRPSVQPYLISWIKYDPAEELKNLDMPVLVVGGTHDLQVPEEQAETLKQANTDAELLAIDGMNHVLKPAPEDEAGNMETYSDPDVPLADGLINGITEFLKNNGIQFNEQ
ncbi:alpha/beta fold hydrolase [Planococcus salinus]|uniref:Alpha/beta fold hydrolase n=2 Tax=Planococcus salinus TaxID=1848460 RepID=A0A3M8PET2_9BACL|nr:alpha/beta fold hydrolase [Planococcus salinus]